MIAGKNLLDYTYLFSPNYYQKNHNITYKYFKGNYDKGKSLGFRQKIDETRIYLGKEIKYNDLLNEKHKKCAGL